MSKINYLFLILFFLSSLALAQGDEFIEKVTVTGTLIKSEKIELVNPTFSISKDDLDKVGTFRIEDYLFKLPQITPSNSALQSQFSSGTASISLRSLGENIERMISIKPAGIPTPTLTSAKPKLAPGPATR